MPSMETEINNNVKESKDLLTNKLNIDNSEIVNSQTHSALNANIPDYMETNGSTLITHSNIENESNVQEPHDTSEPKNFRFNLADDVLNIYRWYQINAVSYDAIICVSSNINTTYLVYKHCHQALLAASSPLLKALLNNVDLKKSSCAHLFLPQINEQDANYILEFIYSTKVILPNMHLASFLKAASILQIKGICNWKETIKTKSNLNTFHEVKRNEEIDFTNSKMTTQIDNDSVELKKEQID